MNLFDQITARDKSIAISPILKDVATASIIRIQSQGVLNKHQSKTHALLILLSGQAIYREDDREVILSRPNDYVRIPARVTHELIAQEESVLLLIQ